MIAHTYFGKVWVIFPLSVTPIRELNVAQYVTKKEASANGETITETAILYNIDDYSMSPILGSTNNCFIEKEQAIKALKDHYLKMLETWCGAIPHAHIYIKGGVAEVTEIESCIVKIEDADVGASDIYEN